MKMSRRGFAGFAAALPFAGNAVAKEMAAKQRESMFANRSMSAGIGQGFVGEAYGNGLNPGPKMEHWQAMRLALADPNIRRELLEQCYVRHRVITQLDPDIACKRSWSDMAKVTFQRQRNVDRDLEQMTADHTMAGGSKLLSAFIKKVMWD